MTAVICCTLVRYFLTFDELFLSLDDLVGEGLLFVVLEDEEVPPPDLVLLEQVVRLHLDLLDLQLVDLAEQGQDLALLLRADPLRKLLENKLLILYVLYFVFFGKPNSVHLKSSRWRRQPWEFFGWFSICVKKKLVRASCHLHCRVAREEA